MHRLVPLLLLLVTAAACRFDGAGFASDDAVGIDGAAGDDVATADAMPDPDDPDGMPLDGSPEPPAAGVLHARPVVGAVALDGNELEFVAAGVDFASFDIVEGELLELLDGYTGSAQVRFGAMHDATYLYFFAAVTDETIQVDSTDVWNDDGVVFYLDGNGDALGGFGNDDHAVVVRGDGMWQDYGNGPAPTLSGTRLLVTGGYNLEIRIARSSLSATIGASMGFDLALTDDDGRVDSDYDGWSMWFKSDRAECASCCTGSGPSDPYCDTTLYGTLMLDAL